MNTNSIRRKVMAGVTAFIAGATLIASVPAASATETADVQTLSQHGGAQRIANTPASGKAKNVILFIGDGMGDSEITVARDYLYGPGGTLNGIDKIGQPGATSATETGVGQYTTYATGDGSSRTNQVTAVTDSAASGSAWATGTKTYNNAVSVDNGFTPQMNLLELAKANGKATGNVTTAEVQDATPAVMESHSTQRSCYGPQGKTDGSSDDSAARCDAEQLLQNGGIGSISEQLLDTRADVTLGGGNKYFNQTAQAGEWAGKTLKEQATERGYQYFEDPSQLASLTEANQDSPVLGLFSSGNIPTQYNESKALDHDTAEQMALAGQKDGNQSLVSCTTNSEWLGNKGASLADMTSKAIDLLSDNQNGKDNGYFLQVEGASIDKQDHNANACGQIGETDDLDKAVAAALSKVDLSDTLIIVTADHAHTSQIVSWPSYYGLTTPLRAKDGSALYVFYGTSSSQMDNGGSMSHTGTQLRIAASGPGASRVDGLTDQTDNFFTIAKTLGLASSTSEINALSDNADVSVEKASDGAYTADLTAFNGDASVSYSLVDTATGQTVASQDGCTVDNGHQGVCGVRVRTTQTTPISFSADTIKDGSTYRLTVKGKQSGKQVVKEFTAGATNSADTTADGTIEVPTTDVTEAQAAAAEQKEALAKTGIAIIVLALLAAVIAGASCAVRRSRNGVETSGDGE
ncbi:alkaline phosphatase [Pseudoscardovia radai]|uniref:alkaline phosphatase n=1 Tax=Pseudoscardovia radai TaxID=987066 RepID=UPI003995B21A